jgi:2-succinyl-5-enolpyruvyl-6-hydroxy-3-cyclohexene-1-carboxylate synthase
VHINAPFRDPLAPVGDSTAEHLRGLLDDSFFAEVAPPARLDGSLDWTPPETGKGIVVAGPARTDDPVAYARAVGRIARTLGWPVLADVLSPVRHHRAEGLCVVAHYDAILRSQPAADSLRPEAVLCLEGWPTSKVLRGWLERCNPVAAMVGAGADNRDGLHLRARKLMVPVEGLRIDAVRPENNYAGLWAEAEVEAARRIDSALEAELALFEPKAAWLLARHLPAGTPLFVANSMPVRDVEYFWPHHNGGTRMHFNRGANGIDGTLSTALGVAHGSAPAVLLTGDLSLLHDTNGLLLRHRLRGSLTVVLINNNGGGIFEHLPVARFDPPFEEYFATPQSVDFSALCSAYGIEHVAVRDWHHFARLISALPETGMRVLEIRTDRRRDAAARRALLG